MMRNQAAIRATARAASAIRKAVAEMRSSLLGIPLAARTVVSFRDCVPKACEEQLGLLIGFESELDSFPLGRDREAWSKPDLLKYDVKLQEYLDMVGESVAQACKCIANIMPDEVNIAENLIASFMSRDSGESEIEVQDYLSSGCIGLALEVCLTALFSIPSSASVEPVEEWRYVVCALGLDVNPTLDPLFWDHFIAWAEGGSSQTGELRT